MTDAKSFADAVGRKNIAAAVGVSLTAVSNAVTRERFPSSWFIACFQLALAARVACPPALFGMIAPYSSQNVDGGQKAQGAKQ